MMPLPIHKRLENESLMRKDDPKSPAASKMSMSICFFKLAEILELMETSEDSMNSLLMGQER